MIARKKSGMTTFATQLMAKETVVCALQPDGEWRVEKYTRGEPVPCVVAAKTTASADSPPTDAETFAREIQDRDYDLDIVDCLRRSWTLVCGDFWPVVGVTTLIVWLLGMVGILGGPLAGGLCLYFLKKIRGEPVRVETAFSGFGSALLPLFLVLLVGGAVSLFGSVCLILPGVFLAGVTTLALALVIDKQLDFGTAFKVSGKTVAKHWEKFLGFTVVLTLLNVAGVLAFGIGAFLTVPLTLAAMMYAYEGILGPGLPTMSMNAAPQVPIGGNK